MPEVDSTPSGPLLDACDGNRPPTNTFKVQNWRRKRCRSYLSTANAEKRVFSVHFSATCRCTLNAVDCVKRPTNSIRHKHNSIIIQLMRFSNRDVSCVWYANDIEQFDSHFQECATTTMDDVRLRKTIRKFKTRSNGIDIRWPPLDTLNATCVSEIDIPALSPVFACHFVLLFSRAFCFAWRAETIMTNISVSRQWGVRAEAGESRLRV